MSPPLKFVYKKGGLTNEYRSLAEIAAAFRAASRVETTASMAATSQRTTRYHEGKAVAYDLAADFLESVEVVQKAVDF